MVGDETQKRKKWKELEVMENGKILHRLLTIACDAQETIAFSADVEHQKLSVSQFNISLASG